MKKSAGLVRVNDVLKMALDRLNLQDGIVVKPIIDHWEEVVGTTIAQKTEPLYVRGSTLIVGCEHGVWITELFHQKASILSKINQLSLDQTINEIRFRLN